jgi:hypothetical protein
MSPAFGDMGDNKKNRVPHSCHGFIVTRVGYHSASTHHSRVPHVSRLWRHRRQQEKSGAPFLSRLHRDKGGIPNQPAPTTVGCPISPAFGDMGDSIFSGDRFFLAPTTGKTAGEEYGDHALIDSPCGASIEEPGQTRTIRRNHSTLERDGRGRGTCPALVVALPLIWPELG